MMGILQIFGGDIFEQGLFHRQGGFAGSNANPVADPENVGVDSDGGLPKLGIEYHIGGFAADPGQGFQRLALGGDFAMVPGEQLFCQGMDMTGFGVEQAKTTNMLLDAFLAKGSHAARIGGRGKQGGGAEVDDPVGTLSGQNDGYQQLKGAGIVEFGAGFRDAGAERGKALFDVLGIHRAG